MIYNSINKEKIMRTISFLNKLFLIIVYHEKQSCFLKTKQLNGRKTLKSLYNYKIKMIINHKFSIY